MEVEDWLSIWWWAVPEGGVVGLYAHLRVLED